MKMSVKHLLSIVFCVITLSMAAQNDNFFEGDLVYRNFENYSKSVIRFSGGMAYNGARSVKVIMKGSNIHIIDETMKFHTLLLPSENKVIIYSDYLKRGQQFDYTNYVNTYLGQFSPNDNGGSDSDVKSSRTSTVEKTGKKIDYLGQECEIYKGVVTSTVEFCDPAVSNIELWVSNKYSIYKSYWSFLYGVQVPGIVTKWTYDQKSKIPLMGTLSSYVASELKEIHERTVSDDEMKVPDGYEIKISSSAFKVLGLYKDNKKYMMKNKIYPTQKESDVTYSIDDKWDF